MHMKLQKDEEMKKRSMTMEKLNRADEMVQSSISKKQQEMEKKMRMEKQKELEAQMNKKKMLED